MMGKQEDESDGTIRKTTNSAYNEGGISGYTCTMTQGEIVFATLACFFVVIVVVFAMYAFNQRRRRHKVGVYVDESRSISTSIPSIEHTMNFSSSIENRRFINGEENARQMFSSPAIEDAEIAGSSSSSWRDYRRRSVDSALTFGSRSCISSGRNQIFGSMTSNVSTEYKLAAIDRMVAKIDQMRQYSSNSSL